MRNAAPGTLVPEANMPLGVQGHSIPGEVRWEFNRAAYGDVYDSLTVSSSTKPGNQVALKLWRNLGQHAHAIYHDPHLSRPSSAARTTYATCLDAAMKFHAHLQVLHRTQQSFVAVHRKDSTLPSSTRGDKKDKNGKECKRAAKGQSKLPRTQAQARRAEGLFNLVLRGVEFRARTVTTVANRTRRSATRQATGLTQTDGSMGTQSMDPARIPALATAIPRAHPVDARSTTSTPHYLDRTFLTYLGLDAFRRILAYTPTSRQFHHLLLQRIERYLRQAPVPHRRSRWGHGPPRRHTPLPTRNDDDARTTCRRALRFAGRLWLESEPIVATSHF